MKYVATGQIRVIDATPSPDGFGFVRYAQELAPASPPSPLKQIFSTMRWHDAAFFTEESIRIDGPDRELGLVSRRHPNWSPIGRKIVRLTFFRSTFSIDVPSDEAAHLKWFHKVADTDTALQCLGSVYLHTYLANGNVPVHHYVRDAVIASKEDKQEGVFIHCKTRFLIETGGREFLVNGSYFVQQAESIYCCAHAAIMMVAQHYHAARNGGKCVLIDPLELNEKVGIDYSSRLPGAGLRTREIGALLEGLGIHSEIIVSGKSALSNEANRLEEDDRVITAAYYSIETSMPAIIGFSGDGGGHAMAVVGHTFEPNLWSHSTAPYFTRRAHCCISSHAWVGNLIVQDDNVGPFRTLPRLILRERKPRVIAPRFPWSGLRSPEKVEVTVDRYLRYQGQSRPTYFQDLAKSPAGARAQGQFWFEKLLDHISDRTYVVRTTVVRPEDYLRFLANPGKFPVLPNGRQELLQKVEAILAGQITWIAELSIPCLYERNNRRLGELLIQEKSQEDDSLLVQVVRVPGVLSIATADQTMDHFQVPGNYHYELLQRTNISLNDVVKP